MNIGIIGCGAISNAYFNACKKFPKYLTLAACADLDFERAKAKAAEHGVGRACSVADLLADRGIDLVVNLTVPKAHADIDCASLEAGKHVFSEKPFALTRAEGERVVALARRKGLRVGCAPDTVLGAGVQTCRALVDEGAIGRPVSFNAFMQCGGHETWHPSPEFYYEAGGGPMFDMGPYYLHALITVFGPVKRVCACTKATWPERTITSQPKRGKVVKVEVPTHITSVLEFANGVVGTLVTSFDIKAGHTLPNIEAYGTEGSLSIPDPNGTGGPVKLKQLRDKEWRELHHSHPYREGSRGVGVADMAAAIATGRPHRANDAIALHALDIMQAVHESSDQGRHITLTSTCDRPAAMRADLPEGTLD